MTSLNRRSRAASEAEAEVSDEGHPNKGPLASSKWGLVQPRTLRDPRSYQCSPSLALRQLHQGVAGSPAATYGRLGVLRMSYGGLLTDMSPDLEVTAVRLEFGTVLPMEVFKALPAENWLHHHAKSDHPRAGEIKTRLLRAFHPRSDEWEALVWIQGRVIVGQALDFLGGTEGQCLAASC